MSISTAEPTALGRAPSALGGEVVLRVRGGPDAEVYELVVDGAFAIDTVDSSTERLLASLTLERLAGDDLRVLVGGLGFGYTVRALLDDRRVRCVDAVELEPSLVEWMRDDRVPGGAAVVTDPRVTARVADVRDAVRRAAAASLDAILLDVDNGPAFLLHEANTALYREPFLRCCMERLLPGGVLAIWSADRVPELYASIESLGVRCEEVPTMVERDGRTVEYVVYLAMQPEAGWSL